MDHPPDGRNAGPNPTLEAAAQDLIRRAGAAVAAQMLLDEEHERIRAGFAALEVTRRAIDLAAGGMP